MKVDTTVLIDRADEAREARADLEARAREAGVFFTDRQAAIFTTLALAGPSEFDIGERDLGLLEEVKA